MAVPKHVIDQANEWARDTLKANFAKREDMALYRESWLAGWKARDEQESETPESPEPVIRKAGEEAR